MTIDKIKAFCLKNNIKYEEVAMQGNYIQLRVPSDTRYLIKPRHNIHITSYGHKYCFDTIAICDKNDYARAEEYMNKKHDLHEVFNMARHEGKSISTAMTLQFEHAKEHGTIEIFQAIYA